MLRVVRTAMGGAGTKEKTGGDRDGRITSLHMGLGEGRREGEQGQL